MTLTILKPFGRGTRVVLALFALTVFVNAAPGRGPKLNPVKWTLTTDSGAIAPGSTVILHLRADIAETYHLYSLTTPPGGPIPTDIKLKEHSAIENVRVFQPKPNRHNDATLNIPVETFTGSVDFPIQVYVAKNAAAGSVVVSALTRYQACSDVICLPPVERTAETAVLVSADARVTSALAPTGYLAVVNGRSAEVTAPSSPGKPLDLRFLLLAFGFGIAAIFTPCVFPTVPLTISYFLNNQKKSRKAAVVQALLFSAGIVVLFSVIGIAVTLIAGPFGVVQLASNPWVNGLIALVFFALALSLLGAFELTLPSSVLTRLNGVSQRGGLVGGLTLGLTFCLTSFACVGPFLGTLLAASVQGSLWQPITGMVAFAAGLATPFFLLSLFPAFLGRLPKSGPWLSRVKVVFAFIILAIALKYLASVDQVLQLHLLTRERFISLWFALFLINALYLLGQLKLAHMGDNAELGLGRLAGGILLLAFAVSLLPALWGGKLGDLESFLPAAEPGSASVIAASSTTQGSVWLKNNYTAALAQAQREHKPLLVSFSGYACTNCHWMKANILQRPEVKAALDRYVLVELYTDGTDAASVQNQTLQQTRFSTVALPYYAVLDVDEKEVAHQAGLTRDPQSFLRFLNNGLNGNANEEMRAGL